MYDKIHYNLKNNNKFKKKFKNKQNLEKDWYNIKSGYRFSPLYKWNLFLF